METRRYTLINIPRSELPGAKLTNNYAHKPEDCLSAIKNHRTRWPETFYDSRQAAMHATSQQSGALLVCNVEYEQLAPSLVKIISYTMLHIQDEPYVFKAEDDVTLQVFTQRETMEMNEEKEKKEKEELKRKWNERVEEEQRKAEALEKSQREERSRLAKVMRVLIDNEDYSGLEKFVNAAKKEQKSNINIVLEALRGERAENFFMRWNITKIMHKSGDGRRDELKKIIKALFVKIAEGEDVEKNELTILAFLREDIELEYARESQIYEYLVDYNVEQLSRISVSNAEAVLLSYQALAAILTSERDKIIIPDKMFKCRLNILLNNIDKDPAATKSEIIKLINEWIESKRKNKTYEEMDAYEYPMYCVTKVLPVRSYNLHADQLKFIIRAYDQIQEPEQALSLCRRLKPTGRGIGVQEILEETIHRLKTSAAQPRLPLAAEEGEATMGQDRRPTAPVSIVSQHSTFAVSPPKKENNVPGKPSTSCRLS